MQKADRITGTITVLFGAWISLLSSSMRLMKGGVPGPGLLPLLCGLMFIGFGLVLILKPADEDVKIPWPKPEDGGRVLGVLGSVAVLTVLVPVLGFTLSSAIFLTGLIWWWGSYRFWQAALMGMALALSMMFIFQVLLGAPLPKGIWA